MGWYQSLLLCFVKPRPLVAPVAIPLADDNGTFLFNGKPQATVFLSQASIQNTVACGLPLNGPFVTA